MKEVGGLIMSKRHQHSLHAASVALESRRGKRFIFLHIPKTAGSTIHHRVLRRSPYFIDVGLESPQPHFTYREVAQQLSRQTLERYWTFCFIRHPVDRYLSRIRYLQRPDTADIVRHKEEWQLANTVGCPKQILRVAMRECPAFLEARHGWPQTSFIVDDTQRIVADFIGTTETFSRDIATVYRRLRLYEKFFRRLRSVNVTGRQYEELKNDAELVGMLREVYAADFELFELVQARGGHGLKGLHLGSGAHREHHLQPSPKAAA